MPMSKTKETNKKKKFNKSTIAFLIGILLLSVAVVIGLWILSGEGRQPEDTVVFTVGTQPVYLDEINLYCLENVTELGINKNQLETVRAQDGTPASVYYKNEILNLIMDTKITYQEAQKEGLSLTEAEEQGIQNDVVAYMGSVNGSVLQKLGITMDTIAESYRQRALAKKLEEQVCENLEVEEQPYCTMYMLMFPKVETNEDGDYVRASDGETPVLLSEEEIARKKEDAQAAYEELKAGKEIEEVAKAYNVELFSGTQSNTADSFGEPFSKYARTLKAGEFSPVLELDSCYVILEMIEENNQELAEQIMAYYRSDMEKEAMEEAIDTWAASLSVSKEPEYNGTLWENISLYDFAQYVED